MEEPEDQIGTMTKACESPIGLLPNLPGVLRGRVQEMSLHIAMASLLGIQVRGVGRQLLHHDLGVLSPISFHLGGAMGLQAIPDHHQQAGEVALEMPQEGNDVDSVDRMVEVPLVDPPRQRQGNRRRYLTPFADPSQDRSPPRGGPCGPRPAGRTSPAHRRPRRNPREESGSATKEARLLTSRAAAPLELGHPDRRHEHVSHRIVPPDATGSA